MNLVHPFHLYFGMICWHPISRHKIFILSASWVQLLGFHLFFFLNPPLPFNSRLPSNFKQLVAKTGEVNGINSGGN